MGRLDILHMFDPNSAIPSGHPTTAACRINAAIDCLILDEDGMPLRECDDQLDPRTFVCNDDLSATGLAFRYHADKSSWGDTVSVKVGGGRTGTVFHDKVSHGQVFRADGDFRGEAELQVFRVNSTDGTVSKSMEVEYNIDTYCAMEDTLLTVTNMWGPFELVGFDNSMGFSTSIVDMQVKYYVGNNDMVNGMYVTSANCTSPFEMDGTVDILSNEFYLGKSVEPLFFPMNSELFEPVYTETIRNLDLAILFREKKPLTFKMGAAGHAATSGLPCSDITTCTIEFGKE